MLVKIESCIINEIIANVAKMAFFGNIPSNSEADLIKKEYDSELFMIHQIHSDCVITLDDNTNTSDKYSGDSIVTKKSGIAIGIVTADCAPIIFIDIKNRIIAVAHAGWKGARYGIIENTINEISRIHKNPDIIAVIGPCIHQVNYEVKQDLLDNFMNENKENAKFFKTENSKMFFDLPSYVKDKLKKNNIYKVYDVEIDTFSSGSFASYRREKPRKKYSNLAIVMLNGNLGNNKQPDIFTKLIKQKHSIEILEDNRLLSRPLETSYTDLQHEYVNQVSGHNIDTELISPKESKQLLKNIKSGKVCITDKLDMHGYNSTSAFSALENFVINNFNNHSRYLLVITGKGRTGESVLKTSFIKWVEGNNDLKKYILTYIESLPEHGGAGAFYLVLRRKQY